MVFQTSVSQIELGYAHGLNLSHFILLIYITSTVISNKILRIKHKDYAVSILPDSRTRKLGYSVPINSLHDYRIFPFITGLCHLVRMKTYFKNNTYLP